MVDPRKYNKQPNLIPLLFCITITLAATHASQLQDLQTLTLHHQDQSYHLPVNVNHHVLKLVGQLQEGRSWVKESMCKVCGIEGEECKDSCFGDKDAVRIACDSSYCSQVGDYNDQSRGISGKEVEMFVKVGENAQVLMPLVLADKLSHSHAELGAFNLFDSESSFPEGMMIRTPLSSLEIYNLKKTAKDKLEGLRQKEGQPLNISMKQEFGFDQLRSKSLKLHHVNNQSFADFQDIEEYELEFSLQSFALQLPFKLAKKLEKHLLENYLFGKKCKLLPKKLKCASQIDATELFQSILHFQLGTAQTQFALPLHLLFTACSANQCNTLINYSQSRSDRIVFGYIVWELYNLEYNLNGRYVVFHRKNTQWDDLFLRDKVDLKKVGFLTGLFLILYHVIKYVIIAIFWLAVASLIINCIIQWRAVLTWLRDLLLRRKKNRIAQECEEDEQYQARTFRRITKLQNPFEDSETI